MSITYTKTLTEEQLREEFDTMIDDAYGLCEVAGKDYLTSEVLQDINMEEYNFMFNDYIARRGYDERRIISITKGKKPCKLQLIEAK